MEKLITDHNALDQYLDVMGNEAPAFIIEIIETFINDAPNQLSKLYNSLSENDADTFCRVAHTLKTAYKTVGAMTLAESFFVLEEMGASGDLSSAHPILNECKSKFDLLKSELISKKESFM
jgi:HPt (histidine-containing phosphotransfer) domain-containing protein